MTYVSFPSDRKFDFTAIGRLCIDLNANEINRPMEQTMTFTKYVGGSPANIAIGMSTTGQQNGVHRQNRERSNGHDSSRNYLEQ